jgi:hypothetical protein
MSSESRAEQSYARWGHFAPELLIVTIIAIIALRFRPMGGSASVIVSLALIMFVLASWIMLRKHDRGLCEHCMLSMPLNPSEQAVRYKRRFWMSHTGADKKFMIPYLVVLIGSNFFPGTAGLYAWAVIQSSMVFLILSYSTHRRLQPWCPWCSEGGGGMERETPWVPEPDYTSTH